MQSSQQPSTTTSQTPSELPLCFSCSRLLTPTTTAAWASPCEHQCHTDCMNTFFYIDEESPVCPFCPLIAANISTDLAQTQAKASAGKGNDEENASNLFTQANSIHYRIGYFNNRLTELEAVLNHTRKEIHTIDGLLTHLCPAADTPNEILLPILLKQKELWGRVEKTRRKELKTLTDIQNVSAAFDHFKDLYLPKMKLMRLGYEAEEDVAMAEKDAAAEMVKVGLAEIKKLKELKNLMETKSKERTLTDKLMEEYLENLTMEELTQLPEAHKSSMFENKEAVAEYCKKKETMVNTVEKEKVHLEGRVEETLQAGKRGPVSLNTPLHSEHGNIIS